MAEKTHRFMHDVPPRVVVVGAGIAGLTAAQELVERGFEVEVVDPAHDHNGNILIGGMARSQWAVVAPTRDSRPATQTDWHEEVPSPEMSPRRARSIGRPLLAARWWLEKCEGAEPEWSVTPRVQVRNLLQILEHWWRYWRDGLKLPLSIQAYYSPNASAGDDPGDEWVSKKDALGKVEAVRETLKAWIKEAKWGGPGEELDPWMDLSVVPRPDRRLPRRPEGWRAVRVELGAEYLPGEHGFRFFPSFYRHLLDTMGRTPLARYDARRRVYVDSHRKLADNLMPTDRFRYAVDPKCSPDPSAWSSFSIRRYPPRGLSESRHLIANLLRKLGYSPEDVARASWRFLVYLTSSVERRQAEYEDLSWSDFMGIDDFGERFAWHAEGSPLALAAMRGGLADARTQGDAGMQLMLDHVFEDGYSDGTLNGPTTVAFLRPWQQYLESQGVTFTVGELESFKHYTASGETLVQPVVRGRRSRPGGAKGQKKKPSPLTVLQDGIKRIGLDDARLHSKKQDVDQLPESGLNSNSKSDSKSDSDPDPLIAPADFYVITVPVERLQALLAKQGLATISAEPAVKDDLGSDELRKFMRFPVGGMLEEGEKVVIAAGRDSEGEGGALRHMVGLQFYFNQDIRNVRGHSFYIDSPWGITAISQPQFWARRPRSNENYLGVISAILTSWKTTVDVRDWEGKFRYDEPKTAWECDEEELASEVWHQILDTIKLDVPEDSLPKPVWYHIDNNLTFTGEDQDRQVLENESPFLVNSIGHWRLRPGMEHGPPSSPKDPPTGSIEYKLQWGNVVFAGHHCKTYTRISSMEAANESARHAVNAILEAAPGVARCDTWPVERHELPGLDEIRELDSRVFKRGGRHPLEGQLPQGLLAVTPWRLLNLLNPMTRNYDDPSGEQE